MGGSFALKASLFIIFLVSAKFHSLLSKITAASCQPQEKMQKNRSHQKFSPLQSFQNDLLKQYMPRKPPRPISPLYARYYTSAEKKSLRAVPANDLSSEINLMRVLFSHSLKLQQSAPKDMTSHMQSSRTSSFLENSLPG